MSERKLRIRFGLGLMFVLVTFASLAIAVYSYYQNEHRRVLKSLRADLQIPDSSSLEIVEFDRSPGGGEKALIVISNGMSYRLTFVHRTPTSPTPNFQRWRISEISVSYANGLGDWIVFEREFDIFPSKTDINEFKRWIIAQDWRITKR